ncbi:MAG: hypothetical protein AB1634_18330 [Thermodesulfobacteriota bacterium]
MRRLAVPAILVILVLAAAGRAQALYESGYTVKALSADSVVISDRRGQDTVVATDPTPFAVGDRVQYDPAKHKLKKEMAPPAPAGTR